VHRDLDDVVEELVEPGAAEDPEDDVVGTGQEAAAVLDEDDEVDGVEGVEDVEEDDEEDDESLFVSLLVEVAFASDEPLSDEVVVDDGFEPDERLSVL
jgi:hypothetical protein